MRHSAWLFLFCSIAGFVSGCSSSAAPPSPTISPDDAAAQQQRANQAQHELDSTVGK